MKHYHVDYFWDELHKVNWFQNTDVNDVHQLSSVWEKEFLEVLDRHALLKARKFCNSHSPYIDNQFKLKMFLPDSYMYKKDTQKTKY